MEIKDLKYLVAYSVPLFTIIGLYFQSYWVFLAPVFAFVVVPFFEIILPLQNKNLFEEKKESKNKSWFFDALLFLNIPLVFGIIAWSLWSVYATFELIGITFSIGLVLGSNGINVAHELGHRPIKFQKTLGKILLIPALYMHFYIEHNFGHHQMAATKEDPASAKYNQTIFSFWFTSITRQYVSAWQIQMDLLKREQKPFFSIKNDMFWYTLIQATYLIILFLTFNFSVLLFAVLIAFIGILLLETINYVEHYGLSRIKTESGRYERMSKIHSWNSNHIMGRIMLYELTRHSDHHYRAHKKYQTLDCHESSPQMPYGYPTSIIISLFPPLWFSIMNKRIPIEMRP